MSTGKLRVVVVAALLLAGCGGLQRPTAPAAPTGPEMVLDHYLCYFVNENQFAPPGGVTIRDQFSPESRGIRIIERDHLCNPVIKSHGSRFVPIERLEAHLFCYRLDYQPVGVAVWISNQFDPAGAGQLLQVLHTREFCVPAGKKKSEGPSPEIPGGMDHFMCYQVKPMFPTGAQVTLNDQFRGGPAAIGDAFMLCNPAGKTHGGKEYRAQQDDAHLVCYLAKMGAAQAPPVRIANQFERVPITVHDTPHLLCVPSTKVVIPFSRLPPPPQEDLEKSQ